MTPDYYKTGDTTDLFDVFVYRYGLSTVQAHLEMAAIEYVYHAGLKGQYTADLAKVPALVERLLTWTKETAGPTMPEKPRSLDDMATSLRASGYLVRSLDDDLEPLLHLLAQRYDYGLIPPNATTRATHETQHILELLQKEAPL